MIIGCDFHTRYQQIAMMDEATGEVVERRLDHESGEAHTFYRDLPKPVRVGIEATGPIQWFQSLLAELGHELWIGDSAQIRASAVRQQKTHRMEIGVMDPTRYSDSSLHLQLFPHGRSHRHRTIVRRDLYLQHRS